MTDTDGTIPGTEGGPTIAAAVSALGARGSIGLLPTPALVCDVDRLSSNIEAMQQVADDAGIALRPHTKSHKSARIARMQLDAGAVGLCVAKLSEAEALVAAFEAAGAPSVDILVTSPLGDPRAARRAAELARRCVLTIVVDHVDGVDELAVATRSGPGVTVLCDVDVGLGRTGVIGPATALDVVERIQAAPSLRFGGIQGYAGHAQHVRGQDLRRQAVGAAADRMVTVIDALETAGHVVAIRTGGGTGTWLLDIERTVLNELQTGSYVFMDREYRDALDGDPESEFAQSLLVVTTVLSTNQTGFVTVDAGLKSMATDAGPAAVVGRPGSTFSFFGDEQGLVTTTDTWRPARGDRLHLVPPHCDPTIDRHDRIWFTRGDAIVEVVPVTARGCSY